VRVQELIGSKVWAGECDGPGYIGTIASVPKPVEAATIEDAIKSSTFRVLLPTGYVVETPGVRISRIEYSDFIQANGSAGIRLVK
jgi:hypothetical protein